MALAPRTKARIGHKTTFGSGNGASPEVFSTLAEVTAITPPNMSRDTIDASHMQSPEEWRESIMGLKDGGELSLELNFVPGGPAAAALMAELDLESDEAMINRKITFPDGTTLEFLAGLSGYEPDAPLDDKMTASATFKVSGKPVLTQAGV